MVHAKMEARYLEDDPATVVLERRGRLKGYEIYLVEQWACSRVHPTFVITTYTGDENHSVTVGVLGVPADEETWSARLRVYFKAITQFHARPKETPFGELMVTNLSSFPSALTVIPVPDGDVRKHREDFIVNENLKRLGCSGRSGLSLAAPAGATQAKFHQLYKTSDKIPLYGAVLELVKLCQVALVIFGKLDQEYADGLLCDVTERGINDWWTEVGTEYYNLEPSDGILGPTTVAALLGMLMGARNRLHSYNAPVSKDAFDVAGLKRGIAYFQKSQKLPRTRRLDRQTLAQLHRVTAKAAAGEGWTVPKAVKSTVAELSGKGGDMVMGMVGGRDKAGIGDIETLDIDRFVNLIQGERSKWLWYGKARRTGTGEALGKSGSEMGNMIFSKDDQGGYMWSSKRNESMSIDDEYESRKKDRGHDLYSARPPGSAVSMGDSPAEKDQQLRKTVFKSVTGKMSDARSGFGRIKDAVGLRGHASRHSKDENVENEGYMSSLFSPSNSNLEPNTTFPGDSGTHLAKSFTWKNKPDEYQNGYRKIPDPLTAVSSVNRLRNSESPPSDSRSSLTYPVENMVPEVTVKDADAEAQWLEQVKEIRRDLVSNEISVAGSAYGDGDLEGPLLEAERDPRSASILLYRRHSISEMTSPSKVNRNEARWPRHVSFSDAEEAVLSWQDVVQVADDIEDSDDWTALQKQRYLTEDFRRLYGHISCLQKQVGTWVEKKVDSVEDLDNQATRDQDEIQRIYYQFSEAYQTVKQSSQDLLSEERSHVMEAVKEIEVLGAKLEYEINALVSKVEDVEYGVAQFEGQVDEVENRAAELEKQLKNESWTHWVIRKVTGLGTGPHLL